MKPTCRLKILFFIVIIIIVSDSKFNRLLAQDSCTFDNVISGNLAASLNELNTLDSEINDNSITRVNGNSGLINVTCTNSATNLNISSVSQSNNAAITLSTFTTIIRGLSSNITSNDGGASVAVPVGTSEMQTLEIDITATYNEILKPGNYSFVVNLEAAP